MNREKLLKNVIVVSLFVGHCLLEAEQAPVDIINTKEFELSLAASLGDKISVKALINEGANVNAHLCGDRVALHEAALFGSIATTRILLVNGADPNTQDDEGNSALHLAAYSGSAIKVKLLLDSGANPDARNEKNQTPLMWLVKAIINNINRIKEDSTHQKKSRSPKTQSYPWNRANNLNCSFEMIRLLVNSGADINAQDSKGRTVLHRAARFAQVLFPPEIQPVRFTQKVARFTQKIKQLIQTLVECGADPTIKDQQNQTAHHTFVEKSVTIPQAEIFLLTQGEGYTAGMKYRIAIRKLLGGSSTISQI
jgi:ankyrin repeat protein